MPPVIAMSFHLSAKEDVDQGMQFWIYRVANFFLFQPLVPYTGAQLHEERVICNVTGIIVHFEFYLRNVTGGMRTPWKLLCVSVTESTGGGQVAWKLEYTMPRHCAGFTHCHGGRQP